MLLRWACKSFEHRRWDILEGRRWKPCERRIWPREGILGRRRGRRILLPGKLIERRRYRCSVRGWDDGADRGQDGLNLTGEQARGCDGDPGGVRRIERCESSGEVDELSRRHHREKLLEDGVVTGHLICIVLRRLDTEHGKNVAQTRFLARRILHAGIGLLCVIGARYQIPDRGYARRAQRLH